MTDNKWHDKYWKPAEGELVWIVKPRRMSGRVYRIWEEFGICLGPVERMKTQIRGVESSLYIDDGYTFFKIFLQQSLEEEVFEIDYIYPSEMAI